MIYDCLIIGSGPAGINASLVLSSQNKQIAIIESSMPGGKVNICPRVDNYPPYKEISGPDLAYELYKKIIEAKIPLLADEVLEINKKGDVFAVSCKKDTYLSKTVIVASGTINKKLDLPNENDLLGHGLSYCAICDGHFFKGQDVTVIGNDKHAVSEAIYLAKICSHVNFVTSYSHILGEIRLIRELESMTNISYFYNSKVEEIIDKQETKEIKLNKNRYISSNGVFVLIGHNPNSSFLNKKLLDSKGFLVTDYNLHTSIEGLYGAGDILSHEIKQIYLADIEGKKAANQVIEYLSSQSK